MSSRQARLTENQETFRDANDRLQTVIVGQVPGSVTVPFLCECADLECRGSIEMTTSDYDAVHVLRNRYVILPGHSMVDGETVLSQDSDGYLVVQKD